MIRSILVSSRVGQDDKTGNKLLFMTLYRFPTRMKNGGLWYPKKGDAVINACIDESKKADEFAFFSEILPGALVDVVLGVNDFTGKTYVASLNLACEQNPYKAEELYL